MLVVGATNTFGRIVAGFFADYKWFNTLLVHNLALISAGLACIANMFCTTYEPMCVFAAVFGLCVGRYLLCDVAVSRDTPRDLMSNIIYGQFEYLFFRNRTATLIYISLQAEGPKRGIIDNVQLL